MSTLYATRADLSTEDDSVGAKVNCVQFQSESPGRLSTDDAGVSSQLTVHPLYGITEKESEVLLWTAQGKTAEEVAVILGISTATVKARMSVIRKKLRANNSNYLICKSFMLGILRAEIRN